MNKLMIWQIQKLTQFATWKVENVKYAIQDQVEVDVSLQLNVKKIVRKARKKITSNIAIGKNFNAIKLQMELLRTKNVLTDVLKLLMLNVILKLKNALAAQLDLMQIANIL